MKKGVKPVLLRGVVGLCPREYSFVEVVKFSEAEFLPCVEGLSAATAALTVEEVFL